MRLKRLLTFSVALISGLLCFASFGLWIRSHQTTDLVVWSGSGGQYYELVTIPSQIRFTRVTNWRDVQPMNWFTGRQIAPLQPVFGQQLVRSGWIPLAIGLDGGSRTVGGRMFQRPFTVAYQIVAVPFALPGLVFGLISIWPLWRFLAINRLMRERWVRGLCVACGYDLRGSPSRCPECGRQVSP